MLSDCSRQLGCPAVDSCRMCRRKSRQDCEGSRPNRHHHRHIASRPSRHWRRWREPGSFTRGAWPRGSRLSRRVRARAAHAAVACLDLHRTLSALPRCARQRRLCPSGLGAHARLHAARSRLSHGGVHLVVRPPGNDGARARVRGLRRSLRRPGPRAADHVAIGTPRAGSRAPGRALARHRTAPVFSVGPFLRSARAIRSAAGVCGEVSRAAVRRRGRDERLRCVDGPGRAAGGTARGDRDRGDRRPRREPRRARRIRARHPAV